MSLVSCADAVSEPVYPSYAIALRSTHECLSTFLVDDRSARSQRDAAAQPIAPGRCIDDGGAAATHLSACLRSRKIPTRRRIFRAEPSDSKLYLTALAFAVARRWPDVLSNAVDPGWVATKMGGTSAPDDFEEGYLTQTWLAVSEEPAATVSGRYWHHRRPETPAREAEDPFFHDQLSAKLTQMTGVSLF
jgi:NAD(P)-dependent dehydrogenase (short-subunit alcohol dehydrogenase family)